MLKKFSLYWWCQICGWLFQAFLFIFTAYSYDRSLNHKFLSRVLLMSVVGIIITHLLRTVILRYKLLQIPNRKLLISFLASVFICGILYFSLSEFLIMRFHINSKTMTVEYGIGRLLWNYLPTIFIWNLIYYMWHYVEKNRQGEIDKLRLEAMVKELELKTIKSQLNPHFIFNSLNSVRALVDENPQRARKAVTELSNILRSSMQAEKVEIVSLEDELSIVQDYLALENIRYEERLKVHFEIDENTLELPVPPLMLQTLVENAIKHGISKSVAGGVVNISSRINGLLHEITIQNTGHLTGDIYGDGFGLQSTRQRLELLYGKKATFKIYNKENSLVEAKVELPL
ncbi:MAG TPA: histidine kinase [Chitinophagaceae bacterium]